MKIQNIHTLIMRNDAHFQFHTEFRDLVNKHDPKALKVKPLFNEYLPLYDKVDEALKKITKSEYTAKINEADKARDEIYIGITETNTAALRHFNPAIREAAEKLKIVFDTYGSVANKTLNEETSAIYNILQELQGKYAESAAAVSLTEWVTELENRNKAFDALVKERFDETASRSGVVLKTARAELDVVYRKIVERLNALIIVEGEADYETFAKTLNAVIAKYSVKKPARNTRAGDNGNTEDTEQPETAGTV